MIISAIAKVFAALYSNKRPGELAGGIALGLWAALIPTGSPVAWFLLVMIFLVKVNQAMALLAYALFSLIAAAADPALHEIGRWILLNEQLYPFWSQVYELPLMPYTRFYNTIVMGGLAGGFLLFLPVFIIVKALVIPIRNKLIPGIAGSKIMQKIYKTPLVAKFLNAYRQWSGFFEVIGG
ncbi:TIGR03546 family protein [Spirochaeta dissipatitropha]